MLLNNVLAGVEYTTPFNNSGLEAPPPGYDSVRTSKLLLWHGTI